LAIADARVEPRGGGGRVFSLGWRNLGGDLLFAFIPEWKEPSARNG